MKDAVAAARQCLDEFENTAGRTVTVESVEYVEATKRWVVTIEFSKDVDDTTQLTSWSRKEIEIDGQTGGAVAIRALRSAISIPPKSSED